MLPPYWFGLQLPYIDPYWWSAPPVEPLPPDPADGGPSRGEIRSPSSPETRPAAGPSSIQPPAAFRPPPLAILSTSGTLRLKVQPSAAQLFVDGFYVGTVEQFAEAGLSLPPGWHRLEFRAPGYQTPAVNVTIDADRTTTYEGTLQPAHR